MTELVILVTEPVEVTDYSFPMASFLRQAQKPSASGITFYFQSEPELVEGTDYIFSEPEPVILVTEPVVSVTELVEVTYTDTAVNTH